MKGIIYNVVEEAVVAEHGEAAWDGLLDRAGVHGAYTSLGSYPDSDLTRLVQAGAVMLGTTEEDLTRHLGHQALLGLARRYPHYFSAHDNARSFLLTLNDVIHPEVRKLHPDSEPPSFWFDQDDPDVLAIHYRSARMLCTLAEGMITGTGAHYGETVEVSQTSCMHSGDDHCTLRATSKAG